MSGTRVLVKLAGRAQAGLTLRTSFRAADLGMVGAAPVGVTVALRHLFDAPVRPAGLAAAAEPAAWYVAEATDAPFGADSAHPWDIAHLALRQGLGMAATEILAVEPDLEQGWVWPPPAATALGGRELTAADRCAPEGQKGAPFDQGPGFGWHLELPHSGLRAARDAVGAAAGNVMIVHLDTGYDPTHAALPTGLDRERQRNFVDSDRPNDATDTTPASGLLTNRGHGTGTLGILAGADVSGLVSAEPIPVNFGQLGGSPAARVVPVRIANSVVHFWTSSVAQGIDYAREIGADVISMSMGGLPSASWADAVNQAYEAGVVIVCAAGNSYGGLPTSLIVYPARFDRVVAACGVMADNHPYHGLGGPMEGNVGPPSKMPTAMAAYTPNIPWLKLGCTSVVDMDGAGTSSATPQIAAAAALWLAQHGAGYPRGWQRVEAVRAALFRSADRLGQDGAAPDPNFGRGLLRARGALDTVPDAASLVRTPADDADFAFLHLLTGAFGATAAEPRQQAMFELELAQLALSSRGAREAVPDPGLPPAQIPLAARRRLLEAILDERTCSQALQAHLQRLLGSTGNSAAAGDATPPRTGADVPRQVVQFPPSRRRLQVFATDPGDSARLGTAGINRATIEVPWEKLEPGPIGEYVEVIDVDPASNAAYEPVDLGHAYILAQDGLAPNEGNPQFHQQMVYAVAMRTIRNFELALGRRVLWAERRLSGRGRRFVPAPEGGYVQRLRIYPHGLRERNAYYSPDRVALLFGYFDAAGPGAGARTVFNCLSHDVVAHETTHALLDGLNRRFQEPTNVDVLAFHEAFADIVAIFQHFTFPELLRHQIGELRGNLTQESILSDLARQFGQSLHNGRALRRALDPALRRPPESTAAGDPPLSTYSDTTEPHERGAILVAAVYDAFVAIYTVASADLFRLATGGSGILRPGAIHPDLVERLAQTAVNTAQHVLTICIRAIDYMPPVDPSFGDYLRALVTADMDLSRDHGAGYRVAFAEAFAARGIYPPNVRSAGPESLCWKAPAGPVQSARLNDFIRTLDLAAYIESDRRRAFAAAKDNARRLHDWMEANLDEAMAHDLGLDFSRDADGRRTPFEVHSVRPAQRSTPEGETRVDVVAVITQRRDALLDPAQPTLGTFAFRGGCTLLLDRGFGTNPIRYAIIRPVWNKEREARVRAYLQTAGDGVNRLYGVVGMTENREPFAAFHRGLAGKQG